MIATLKSCLNTLWQHHENNQQSHCRTVSWSHSDSIVKPPSKTFAMMSSSWQSSFDSSMSSCYCFPKVAKHNLGVDQSNQSTVVPLCCDKNKKRTKNRDQKRPNHDAYTHLNEHLRALVPATNQKRHAHRWRPTGTRPKAIKQRRIAEMDSHPRTDPGPHGTNSRMLSPQDNHEPTHDIPRNE